MNNSPVENPKDSVKGPSANSPLKSNAEVSKNNTVTAEPGPTNRGHRSKILTIVTILILGIALGLFLLWYQYFRFYESTDDAFANGSMININSAVNANVVAFYADNTDLVTEGQLLVLLDRTNYQIAYDQSLASLAATVLQVRQLYDNVKVNAANRDAKRVRMQKAQYDYDNRAKLIGTLSISNEDYIHAKDDLTIAELDLKQAEHQLKMSLDAVGNTSLEMHPIIEENKAKVREAYCNLKHCSIYSPATGFVAQRVVEVGKWVQPTSPLMAVIPKDYVWVDANFKETELTNMRVGQPARVTLDIYGSDVVYEGKVLGIASGTGSVFSVIPPQNATGNWIKIVQRLPVRISLDPETLKNYPVRLGLSAYATVNITDTSLPMLVQETVNRPVTATSIFDINMDEINRIIDGIVLGT